MTQEKSSQNHGKVPAYLIDSPSPFETKETWEKFLKFLKSLPQDDPAVIAEIEEARELVAEKKAEEMRRL